MRRPLALYDIDKTLIDQNYDPNSPDFPQSVAALQAAGWTVGLNSDTPALRIARLAQEWGCEGPIVAEFGNAVYLSPEAVLSEPECDPRWSFVPGAKSRISEITGRLLEELRRRYSDYYTIIGNPMDILGLMRTGSLDRPVIVVNSLRRYSLSFFVRVPGREPVRTRGLLAELATLAHECFCAYNGSTQEPLIDINHEYGVVIVHFPRACKPMAMPFLQQHFHPIVMVGDSSNDLLGSGVTQLAVGNAYPEYKDKCSFVAQQPLTLGAIECAQYILRALTPPRT